MSEPAAGAAPVEERPFRLELNGRSLAYGTASPGQMAALAAGRLLADGYIARRADLLQLEVEEGPDATIVRARVAPAGEAAGGVGRAALARGGWAELQANLSAGARRDAGVAPLPPLAAFGDLFRELFGGPERRRETSGLHSAALCDGARLLHRVEEVGRHNAVDKAIGLALLAGDEPRRLGLLLSARVSGEMARKAARAGIAWIASRSVPTTLAVAVAEAAAMPIVARAPGPTPVVYGGARARPGGSGESRT